MTVNKRYIVKADVGESLEEFKRTMLNFKSESDEVYGIFNGYLYVCYPYYEDIDQIDIY